MQVTRRLAGRGTRALLVTGGVVVMLAAPTLSAGATSSHREGHRHENRCTDYATYTALGEGDGIQTVESAPGVTIVDTVDGDLPGVQAEEDSLAGSSGWSGAPYSGLISDNVGAASLDPNQIPIFAVSDYPAHPKASNSTADTKVASSSTTMTSYATANAAGPSSGPLAAAHLVATAKSSCVATSGTLRASADTELDALNIKGILHIGAITSHADALSKEKGKPILHGSMSVAGVTVLGQTVAITSKGLKFGGSTIPFPASPLASALSGAGIKVNYLAAVKRPKQGEVQAPGVQVVVTQHVSGIGSGVVTSTYVLGRAEAVAIHTNGPKPPGSALPQPSQSKSPSTSGASGGHASSGVSASSGGDTGGVAGSRVGSTGSPPRDSATGTDTAARPAAYLTFPSTARFYAVVAGGGLLMLVTIFGYGVVGVRLRWR